MALPEDYIKGSVSDARSRFQGTIISYENQPVYMSSIDHIFPEPNEGEMPSAYSKRKFKEAFYQVKADINLTGNRAASLKLDDEGFNIRKLGARLGAFNLQDNVIGYITRVPVQSMVQGLGRNNLLCGVYVDGTYYSTYSPNKTYLYKGKSANIFDIVKWKSGEADKIIKQGMNTKLGETIWAMVSSSGFKESFSGVFPQTLTVLGSEAPFVKALSPKYVIERDNFGDIYLLDRGVKAGKFNGKDRIKYLPKKEYIAGDVERVIGIKSV